MNNKENWKPTKYIYKKGRLIASRDKKEVGIGSRLLADIIAEFYDTNLKKYAKGKLLDLGCGKVPLYHAYKDYVSDNICVDWKMNNYLDFEHNLSKPLPFPDNEFDTIILSDVLEHIYRPELLWKEMYRILSPHGKIIMNVPFFYWIHAYPYDFHRYTEFALKQYVEDSRFKLILLERIGGIPEILTDIFAKTTMTIPLIGKSLSTFAQFITKLFVKTSIGKRISQKTSRLFPLGYFLIAEKSFI